MLTDKQSLLLCGLMAMGIFVAGILSILGNFVVLTLLTIIFLAIVINLFFWKHPKEESDEEPAE
ncbi:hypothetical protein [Confluentibacter flavum]|uniref:Uncharacterized protein n=1 Tax=Confluentibacter flavum TaxID=1909700 RepID=A0A2N3HMY3_9FLAO|nr:hypothetical protein [Confluentibacter flavum]PKQ46320.1 hypothetical protein CSW08_03930 [Confluentibacter flavum]